MPEIAIKLVVVLDTTVAESARFNFDSGSLGELQTEAQEGSLKIALTEVQAGEMRAHVKEQSDAIRSVAKALRPSVHRSGSRHSTTTRHGREAFWAACSALRSTTSAMPT